jgi:hypothetical protein
MAASRSLHRARGVFAGPSGPRRSLEQLSEDVRHCGGGRRAAGTSSCVVAEAGTAGLRGRCAGSRLGRARRNGAHLGPWRPQRSRSIRKRRPGGEGLRLMIDLEDRILPIHQKPIPALPACSRPSERVSRAPRSILSVPGAIFRFPDAPSSQALAAFQAAWRIGLFTQGIGLRPQPWAGISRPVGPVLLNVLTSASSIRHHPIP